MKAKSTVKQAKKPIPLTPNQLKLRQEHLQVIDVRGWLEYLLGHIPGAQRLSRLHILKRIPQDQAIAVVCLSGHRSLPVAQWLVQQGYQQVYNLQGGLIAWKNDGNAVNMGNRP